MSEERKKVELLSYLKDISTFLRDILITIIVAICIFNPSSIKSFLKESGLSKLGVFGVSFELKEEKEKIATAQGKVTAQVLKAENIEPGEAPIEALNKPVDQNFKQAILSVERIAPQLLPTAGWVFLGRVNQEKTEWLNGSSSTTTATWPVAPGDVLTVRDDVYVREITNDKWHSKSPVATVAKVGDMLKVVELDYSSAKDGGFFVWVKVAIQSSVSINTN